MLHKIAPPAHCPTTNPISAHYKRYINRLSWVSARRSRDFFLPKARAASIGGGRRLSFAEAAPVSGRGELSPRGRSALVPDAVQARALQSASCAPLDTGTAKPIGRSRVPAAHHIFALPRFGAALRSRDTEGNMMTVSSFSSLRLLFLHCQATAGAAPLTWRVTTPPSSTLAEPRKASAGNHEKTYG